MSRVIVKVNCMLDIGPTCIVDTSNERCEIGKHIQDVDSVFPLAVSVQISTGITFDPIFVN